MLLIPTCHHWIPQELPVNNLLSLAHLLHEVGWGNKRLCVLMGTIPSSCDFTISAQCSTFAGRMTGQCPQALQMSWEYNMGVKGALFRIPLRSLSLSTGLFPVSKAFEHLTHQGGHGQHKDRARLLWELPREQRSANWNTRNPRKSFLLFLNHESGQTPGQAAKWGSGVSTLRHSKSNYTHPWGLGCHPWPWFEQRCWTRSSPKVSSCISDCSSPNIG